MRHGYWYRENLSHVLIFRGCRGVVVERCVLYGKVSGSIPDHSQSIRNDRDGKYLTTSPLRMEIYNQSSDEEERSSMRSIHAPTMTSRYTHGYVIADFLRHEYVISYPKTSYRILFGSPVPALKSEELYFCVAICLFSGSPQLIDHLILTIPPLQFTSLIIQETDIN